MLLHLLLTQMNDTADIECKEDCAGANAIELTAAQQAYQHRNEDHTDVNLSA